MSKRDEKSQEDLVKAFLEAKDDASKSMKVMGEICFEMRELYGEEGIKLIQTRSGSPRYALDVLCDIGSGKYDPRVIDYINKPCIWKYMSNMKIHTQKRLLNAGYIIWYNVAMESEIEVFLEDVTEIHAEDCFTTDKQGFYRLKSRNQMINDVVNKDHKRNKVTRKVTKFEATVNHRMQWILTRPPAEFSDILKDWANNHVEEVPPDVIDSIIEVVDLLNVTVQD